MTIKVDGDGSLNPTLNSQIGVEGHAIAGSGAKEIEPPMRKSIGESLGKKGPAAPAAVKACRGTGIGRALVQRVLNGDGSMVLRVPYS